MLRRIRKAWFTARRAWRLLLCALLGHPWRSVWFERQPAIIARECRRCGRHERRLGSWWAPAGEHFQWL